MPLKVALVSPSGVIDQSQLDLALAKATSLGIEIICETKNKSCEIGFLNGSKDERLLELSKAEKVPVDAIWCVRGGFGAIELWNEYQKDIYQNHETVLVGYSDITLYHFMRFHRAGRIGIHGPIFLDLLKGPNFLETLELLVNKKAERLIYPALKSVNHFLANKITGELIVMNLASLQSIVGCFEPSFFQNKILALEDINEPPYKVLRMLLQLKNAGVLFGLKALIIGHFNENRPQILELSVKIADELGIALFDWPIFGHDSPNWPLYFGAKCSITKVDELFFTLNYDEQHDHTPIQRA